MIKTYTEKHDFMLSVLGNIPYGIIAMDMEGFITMINEQAHRSLGFEDSIKNMLEKNILDYLGNFRRLYQLLNDSIHNGRKAFNLTEEIYLDKYLTIAGKPVLNGMLLTINDVSQAKQARDEATLALFRGQEIERRRIAKEIHDGIGPLMSTIRLNLDAVQNDLSNVSEKTMQKVRIMDELVQEVSNDIRNISHALMPSALIDFGLVRALASLCEKTTRTEVVDVQFYPTGLDERLPKEIELALYRISQELLHNALKYAQAKTITVQLVKRTDKIVLTVEDDGIGFDAKDAKQYEGIGLRNIYTRTHSLNGQFIIDTIKGRGVHTTIEIPL